MNSKHVVIAAVAFSAIATLAAATVLRPAVQSFTCQDCSTEADMKSLTEGMHTSLNHIWQTLDRSAQKIDEVATRIDANLDKIDAFLKKIGENLNSMNASLEEMSATNKRASEKIDALKDSLERRH